MTEYDVDRRRGEVEVIWWGGDEAAVREAIREGVSSLLRTLIPLGVDPVITCGFGFGDEQENGTSAATKTEDYNAGHPFDGVPLLTEASTEDEE